MPIFNKTILNIMIIFIPHTTKTFNDRKALCINNKVKTMIQEKIKIYELYLKNKVTYWQPNLKHCKV